MAQNIMLSDIPKLKSISYQEYMPEVVPGTLLFCAGNYFVSHLIQRHTHSLWSHLGIVFNVEEIQRTILIESSYGSGVRIVPLSKYTMNYVKDSPYKGSLILAQVEGVTPEQEKRIAQIGISLLTSPYDTDELVKGFLKMLKGSGTPDRDKEYHCAELVYECFLAGGIEFQYDPRGCITPESIWSDPRVSILGRIEKPVLVSV